MHEFRVRRKDQLGPGEEFANAVHDEALDKIRATPAQAIREPSQGASDTAGGKLVKIGVPGSHQRRTKSGRDDGAKYPEVAGAGDVDEVRAESAHLRLDGLEQSQEPNVEAQIGIDREG